METIKQLFWISRPVSWINTAFPFAAAYLVLAGGIDAVWLLGSLYFLIPYNLLMYGVNDVFDYESDIKNPRKGGVQGAVAERRFHRKILVGASVVNVPVVSGLLLLGTAAANTVLLALVFFAAAYSVPMLRFKERPVLDSITSAIHFAGPMVYAMVFVGWHTEFWPFVLAFLLWGMASHAYGAVQDILPDRSAGIASIATVFGAQFTVRIAFVLYMCSAVLLALQPWPSQFVAAAVLLYAGNITPYLNVSDTRSADTNAGWKRFMWLNMFTGFVITMVLIAF